MWPVIGSACRCECVECVHSDLQAVPITVHVPVNRTLMDGRQFQLEIIIRRSNDCFAQMCAPFDWPVRPGTCGSFMYIGTLL
jgi:hypothetical protein